MGTDTKIYVTSCVLSSVACWWYRDDRKR